MKIGLALGGGSVLGAAHIGVLRAMEEKGVHISALSGTSVGALVAGLYAFGVPVDEIEQMSLKNKWFDISSIRLSKFSLFANDKLATIIKDRLGDVLIEDAKIPLAIIATDIVSGERVEFVRGRLADAVQASTCLPGVYAPVEIDGRLLVDGGLVDNVPVSALKGLGAKYSIAIDLSTNRHYQKPENIIDVISNAVDISMNHAIKLQLRSADLVIAPDVTAKSRINIDEVKQLIEIGYVETTERLQKFNKKSILWALLKTYLLLNQLKRLLFRMGS